LRFDHLQSEFRIFADATQTLIDQGKVSFASLGGLDLIHSFITDDAIADEDRRRFEDMGVRVILAK